jgi:epoxide hydrolase 4
LRRKISVPTLVIWGTKDGALEQKLAELSGRFVEQYSVHYIEGASHWVQQDEPQQFNSLMRQFLKNEL